MVKTVFVVGLMKYYVSSSSVYVFSCVKEQCSCNTAKMCFYKLHVRKHALVLHIYVKIFFTDRHKSKNLIQKKKSGVCGCYRPVISPLHLHLTQLFIVLNVFIKRTYLIIFTPLHRTDWRRPEGKEWDFSDTFRISELSLLLLVSQRLPTPV